MLVHLGSGLPLTLQILTNCLLTNKVTTMTTMTTLRAVIKLQQTGKRRHWCVFIRVDWDWVWAMQEIGGLLRAKAARQSQDS